MAARKTTKPKSETSAPRTRKKAEPAPEVQESAGLSRAAWGAIWAGLGVLTLLALLPIDGALLRWLHRSIGGFIGRGGLLLPFALFALSALLGVTGVWLTFPAVEALACALSLLFILRSPK